MKTFLTGVKPTGTLNSGFHLGNYVSVIKPIKEFLKTSTGFLFLADVHALNEKPDPNVLTQNSAKMLATLFAFFKKEAESGKLAIYRQSAFPETFELSHLLTQFMPKGLLNRCHAYKAKIDAGQDVNLGLFIYPHLMATDILQLQPDIVPVGKDQLQHIEVTKELARVTNNFLCTEFFKIPEAFVQTEEVLLGVDGQRKMSKSYNNTIPVFENLTKIKKLVFSIPTNFKNVGEPKDFSESAVCSIYQALAEPEETEKLKEEMTQGIGWGEVKKALLDKITELTSNARPIYDELMSDNSKIFNLLNQSEPKVHSQIQKTLIDLKGALGCFTMNV